MVNDQKNNENICVTKQDMDNYVEAIIAAILSTRISDKNNHAEAKEAIDNYREVYEVLRTIGGGLKPPSLSAVSEKFAKIL